MTDYSILLSTQLDVSGIQAQLEELAGKYSIDVTANVDTAGLQSVQSQASGIQSQIESQAKTTMLVDPTSNNAALQELQVQAKNIQDAVGESASKISISSTYIDGVQTATTSTKTFNDELGNTVKQVEAVKLGEDGTVVSTKNVTTSVLDLNKASQTAFGGWMDEMGSVIQRTLQWSAALAVVYGAFRSIQDGVTYVGDLNNKMTQTQAITGQTSQQVQGLYANYQDLAQQLGSTTMEVAQASDGWLRQGKSAQDATALTTQSVMVSKLAMTDTATATQYLTAMINGFGMSTSDVSGAVDKMLALSNSAKTSAAVSFDTLNSAMQVSAATAKQTGVTYDQLNSYIATIATVTQQSGDTIGNTMKSMFGRMESIKAGATEDGVTLNNVDKTLQSVGITMRDVTTGAIRPLGDIIDELGKKWSNIGPIQQAQITYAVAGLRQMNAFNALMGNFNKTLEYQTSETQALGLEQQRFNIILGDTETAAERSKSAWSDMWAATINSGAIKSFYDLSTGIAEVIKNAGGLTSVLLPILGIFAAFKASAIVDVFIGLKDSLGTMNAAIRTSFDSINNSFRQYSTTAIETETVISTTTGEEIASFEDLEISAASGLGGVDEALTTTATTAKVSAAGIVGALGLVVMAVTSVIAVYQTWQSQVTQNQTKGLQDSTNAWKNLFGVIDTSGETSTEVLQRFADGIKAISDAYNNANPIAKLFVDQHAMVEQGLEQTITALRSTSSSWDEYIANVRSAVTEAGYQINSDGQVYDSIHGKTGVTVQYNDTLNNLIGTQANYVQSAHAVAQATDEAGNSAAAAAPLFDALGNAMNESAQASQTAFNSAVSNVVSMNKQNLQDQISTLEAAGQATGGSNNAQKQSYQDLYNKQKDLLDKRKQDLTDAYNAEKNLNDQEKADITSETDAYNALIDAQKTLLQAKQDEQTFDEQRAADQTSLSKLEAEIAAVSLDTSAEGLAKKASLEDQATKLKTKMDDNAASHSTTLQMNALDAEKQSYDDAQKLRTADLENEQKAEDAKYQLQTENLNNKLNALQEAYQAETQSLSASTGAQGNAYAAQIAQLKEHLSESGTLNNEARSELLDKNSDVYNKLIEWNRKYGTGLDSDVSSNWALIITYAEMANQLAGGSAPTPQFLSPYDPSSPFYSMTSGGSGNNGSAAGNIIGAPHHTGVDSGFVGGVNSNEEFSKLMKGELVLNTSDMSNFMHNTLPAITSSVSNGNINFDHALEVNISGNVDSSVMPDIEKLATQLANQLTKNMANRGVTRSVNSISI